MKIFYLTYQETPESSIFKTQIADVVKFWKEKYQQEAEIKLVSFIPLKGYSSNRIKILNLLPDSIILPQLPIPRMFLWKLNSLLLGILCIFKKPDTVIGRSIFATFLGLKMKGIRLTKKVVFDSRGVITEEAREYGVYPKNMQREIIKIEKYCTERSDFMLVITKQMVAYFSAAFGYNSKQFEIIPCTLGLNYIENNDSKLDERSELRRELGYSASDCILVYSGSNAGWQSFDLMLESAELFLNQGKASKLLLLTQKNELVNAVLQKYPSQVQCLWIKSEDVNKYLNACDYGLMIRESTQTNAVSSPTKFAEYLASGLPVIASDNMAISDFIKDNQCGILLKDPRNIDSIAKLKPLDTFERSNIKKSSHHYFGKTSPFILEKYNKLFRAII